MRRIENPTRPRTIDDLVSGELIARVTRLDLASRKIFAGRMKGERRSKKRGESVEFADHRPYVTGDDLRHIDWNIYGRLDRLFMKLFLEEEDLSLQIAVDCSASMDCGSPSKFEFIQKAAATLAYIGLINMNRVTLTALGQSTDEEGAPVDNGGIRSNLRNLRGRRRVREMGDWLCRLDPAGGTAFSDAARRIALTRQGKGVMVILSDFFFKEGYEQGLRYLLGRGYDLVVIQVLSPQEVEPDLGGDLRLRDVEDGDAAEVTISGPLLKRYKANLAAYCKQLHQFCIRREITFLTVQSDLAIDALMLDYLRARGVLR
ncbi:MAG: DUF58 domain-containing protein [Phycisphaerales bacterium]|nr:DUF58 domain-containing protein [Phycisphaerales bacterium]